MALLKERKLLAPCLHMLPKQGLRNQEVRDTIVFV